MKFSARRGARRGRTSRSPRMSCSLMTAASSVSKPLLDAEHGERDRGLGQAERLRPGADRRQIVQLVVGQHVAHALARALAPQRDGDALAGRLQRRDVLADRLEHIGARLGALGREIAPGARADIDRLRAPPAPRRA